MLKLSECPMLCWCLCWSPTSGSKANRLRPSPLYLLNFLLFLLETVGQPIQLLIYVQSTKEPFPSLQRLHASSFTFPKSSIIIALIKRLTTTIPRPHEWTTAPPPSPSHLCISYLNMHLIHGRASLIWAYILPMGVHLTYGRASYLWACIYASHIWLCTSYMAVYLSYARASHTWACISHMGVYLF